VRTISYLAPTAIVGGGFDEAAFRAALTPDIAFIGSDAGSCDGGPGYLGAHRFFQSRAGVKRDLRLMLIGARSLEVPLLIGSCGGSGANWNLDWVRDIVLEIAAEEQLSFRLALIRSEPDRDDLVRRWREGRIRPLDPAPPLDEAILRGASAVVAMAGAETFQAALEQGADVILAGRATDASIFAAIPLREGFDPGLCWHAAKIMECGSAAAIKTDRPAGMRCTIEEDRFILEPNSPEQRCTPVSIAAHALYETGDPFQLKEPGGTLDLTDARYEALSERRVAVSGSRFRVDPYTVRLEGATLVGYQAMSIGGIRDPVLLARLDNWLDDVRSRVRRNVASMYGWAMDADYQLTFRCYGRDGVLGAGEPLRSQIGHEVGLMLTVLAYDQDRATTVARYATQAALHQGIPEWQGSVSNLAFPMVPHVVPLGPAYRFVLNHVLELDDPMEIFDLQLETV
jgi:hypothetical protein